MPYFTFTDQCGQHRISHQAAASFLGVSLRTVQNYAHPDRRDHARWQFLTAYATGRLLPEAWGLRVKGNHLYSATGYSFEHWELSQLAHVHSTKDNTIAGLKRQIKDQLAAIESLTAQLAQLEAPTKTGQTAASNVIPFRRK